MCEPNPIRVQLLRLDVEVRRRSVIDVHLLGQSPAVVQLLSMGVAVAHVAANAVRVQPFGALGLALFAFDLGNGQHASWGMGTDWLLGLTGRLHDGSADGGVEVEWGGVVVVRTRVRLNGTTNCKCFQTMSQYTENTLHPLLIVINR